MRFQISALPYAPFADLFDLDDAALKARGALRATATHKPGFPCRVSLTDAEPGEEIILVNYEHQDADSPYRSRHAVWVRRNAEEARPAVGETPAQLRTRILSLRAFDADGMIVTADLVEGAALESMIDAMLADPADAYIHAHFAKPGCYAALIDRA